jgi:hypothetical protein
MSWRILSKIAAMVLLALLCADLSNASCDPIRIPQDPGDHISSAQELPDPCADVCISDCFCCAPSLPAASTFELPRAGVAPGRPGEMAESPAPGVHPLVDHIPIPAT